MKYRLFRVPTLALVLSALTFTASARQTAPNLPPLHADASGQLKVGRNELFPAEFAIAVASAAQATKTDPAFLFALAARSKFAANAHGASAGQDPDAPVGGPYAYGSEHWLNDLALYGEEAGYPEFAKAITRSLSGTLTIADPELRSRAMTARTDPYLSSFLAAKAWRRARVELRALRKPSEGLVMIAFRGGVDYANRLAERLDEDYTELLATAVGTDSDVLLTMAGLPASDARAGAEWTIGNFIDEITSLLRHETSAYSAARRIDVPEHHHPHKPMSPPTKSTVGQKRT
jgi:hypothetical protein